MSFLTSINPLTEERVGQVPLTTHSDLSRVMSRAHRALPAWSALSAQSRGELFKRAGEQLAKHAEELAELIGKEMGKPRRFGEGEVQYCASGMAQRVDNIIGALQPVVTQEHGVETVISYQPVGVVAAISPWNFPVMMPHKMVIPALMAGNTVVLKPSEETPLAAQAYADILNQFLPEGVLQVVHGGRELGRSLVEADVSLVSFTGSRNAGVQIMKSCAERVTRLVLELGGKDPLIVLSDADVEAAAQFAVENSFDNAGQQCISTERAFVHESIADVFEQRVAEIASATQLGAWDDPDADMGTMVHARQRQLVIDQIEQAKRAGARVLLGAESHPHAFVAPTVLADVAHEMTIAREETFGPVIAITRYADVDDAVEQANDTPYGLSAVVFGADVERASAVASRLQAGMVGINKNIFAVGDAPWVGAKQSGFGYNGSPDGYRQFTQVRVTSRPVSE